MVLDQNRSKNANTHKKIKNTLQLELGKLKFGICKIGGTRYQHTTKKQS
jgi:hypothetical protein